MRQEPFRRNINIQKFFQICTSKPLVPLFCGWDLKTSINVSQSNLWFVVMTVKTSLQQHNHSFQNKLRLKKKKTLVIPFKCSVIGWGEALIITIDQSFLVYYFVKTFDIFLLRIVALWAPPSTFELSLINGTAAAAVLNTYAGQERL